MGGAKRNPSGFFVAEVQRLAEDFEPVIPAVRHPGIPSSRQRF
jgi:hypothetical protein